MEQEWLALARALDPVRLLKQVERLQQAVFRCAVGVTPFPHRQPAIPVLRFYEHLCQTRSFSRSQEKPVERDPAPPKPPETIDLDTCDRSPFSDMTAPKVGSSPVQMVEPKIFARLLTACRPPERVGHAGEKVGFSA
jgi:hypothetical protein